MANDPTRQVHSATHPSGHLNKTPVNAENPIFARPADPTPPVSIGQASLAQSDPKETVVSPLINDAVESPVEPAEEETPEPEPKEETPQDTEPAEAA